MTRPQAQLKTITKAGVAAALLKGHRYRVLNDSIAAESICLDVLAVEPDNVEALVMHALSITDQFHTGHAEDLARAGMAVDRLADPYKNAYYHGVICERWAWSVMKRAVPHAGEMAYDWIAKALDWYAKAEAMRAPGNDESILRWNTCVRMLQRDPHLKAREAEAWEPSLE
jgi:hypothetical protein